MALTEQSTWERGAEGEDLFDAALRSHPVTNDWYRWLRNVRLILNEKDCALRGIDYGQYLANFITQGDLDFVLIGPSGVWLFDVKNWQSTIGPGDVWQQRMDSAAQSMTIQRDFLRLKLDEPIQCAFVMAGKQQPFDGIGDFPMYSVEDTINTVLSAPLAFQSPAEVDELWDYAMENLSPAGVPSPR